MKKAVAAVVAALAIAVSAVGAIAADNKPDQEKIVVNDGVVVVVTSVPRGGAPEIPGKPNRKRTPVPTGQDMTHTTGTVVRFQ
jgi:hypothetical protein